MRVYGSAGVSKKKRNNFNTILEGYIRKRENLVELFVLIDSRLPPQDPDIDFINKLDEWQLKFSLVFTKTDKVKSAAAQKNLQTFLSKMGNERGAVPQYFFSSSVNKSGRKELIDYMMVMSARTGNFQ